MRTSVICFDMDGTLVDTAPDLVGALNAVLSTRGYPVIKHDIAKTMIGHGAGAMIQNGLRLIGTSVSNDELAQMEAEFGAHYDANYTATSKVFEGVPDGLKTLNQDGHALAVCSNTGEALVRRILTEFDLIDHFEVVCGGDTTETKKPDPGSLQQTIKSAGGDIDRALLVGDAETDIEAAKRAGVSVVALEYGYSFKPVAEFKPTQVAANFPAAIAAVRKLTTRFQTA